MIRTFATNKLENIILRPATFMDVPHIFYVEKRSYEHHWSESLFYDCIKVGYHCWVIEHNSKIIGFAIFRVEVGEAHLFNIAVDPGFQRKGVGRAFLGLILQRMKDVDAKRVIMEVRVSNLAARKIYKDYNFKEIGIRKDYYPDGDDKREDGINLELIF